MCKQSTCIWSIFLVVIMIINMLPVQALAADTDRITEDPIIADDTVSTEDLHIVEEIVDRRTEYTKEFLLNNGFRVASVYAYPVHYEDNGEWKEIDNTLKLSSAKSGNIYTNTAGIWDVSFPQSMTKDKAISVTKDGHTLSFRMTGEMRETGNDLQLEKAEIIELPTFPDMPISENQNESTASEADAPEATGNIGGTIALAAPAESITASVETLDIQAIKAEEQYPEMVSEKLGSRLSYGNLYENTDVVFDMTSNMLKESVILKEYNDSLLGYTYALGTGDMIPVLQENGAIELRDPDSDELIMFMPAPYLIDDAGATNHEIEVSLGGGNGSYVLTYALPQAWLADEIREWPVVLDPAIMPSLSILNIEDVTLSSGGYLDHTDEYLHCGYHSSNTHLDLSRIFLKFTNLPELCAADVVIYAQATLNFVQSDYAPSKPAPIVEVHKVNGTWQSNTISRNNNPGFNDTVEDFYYVNWAGHQYWTVTDIVREWYEGENTGMMFKLPYEAEAAENLNLIFSSSDHSSYNVSARPSLILIFRNNNGVESYWDYTSSSAGRAGTGYVNQYTGNLTWVRNDIGFGGNRMPVSISHVYNANDTAQNLFGLGYGWRTNFNQRVYDWNTFGAYGDYYVWEDSDGTDHYFGYVSPGTYKDEDGLELTLTIGTTDNEKYTITDKNGNTSIFDRYGRLRKQVNNQETKSNIAITYTTNSGFLISTITDGVGRVYTFTYANNLLSQISYSGTGTTILSYVNFAYDANSNLITVTDKDAAEDSQKGVSTYTYAENHLLQSAQDVDGYKLTYRYTTTTAGKPNRIKIITESAGGTLGTNLGFEYAHNQTKLTEFYGNPDDGEPTWDVKNTQLIQFNNMGNTVSGQDDEGRAQYAQYAINDPDTNEASTASTAEEASTEKGNQLKLTSKLQNTVANILYDTSFEDGTTWQRVNDGIGIIDTTTSYLGSCSLKMTTTSSNHPAGVSSLVLDLDPNNTYTFSAYVKTTNGSAYLAISDGTDSATSEVLPANSDWTRLEVSYTTGASVDMPIAELLSDDPCVVYMDCVQLEAAPTASRYNLLQNGDFARVNSGWSSSVGRTTAANKAPAGQLDNKVYTLAGDPMATNRVSQTVNASGENGDTYVLAGWAKADSVPIYDDREFGLIATFMNGETVVNKSTVRFNECADSTIEWQYAAAPVVAKGAYDSILIEVAYDYNANTAYFDGIQLFKEEFGTSYTYDEYGNVTSVVDVQKQKTTYEYTENNLTKEVLPTGAELTYEYDDWHNVTKATSDTGVVYEFTYDEYGNNTSVSITSGGVKLTSLATYSADKNYLVSTKDAAGNTTTYDYDSNTGTLKSVKYPKDTDSTKTTYTYDNMYRLASAAMNNDGTTLSASYTYSNDLLTKITTGSTVYNFSYGDFSLRSNIKVGSQLLATYDYDDQNHNLTSLTYGNGEQVSYRYDDHGRLLEQVYSDTEEPDAPTEPVTYQYDNNGALAVVSDSGSGITTTYYYDFTDRLMKYAEKASSFSHIVGYEYDTINNLTALVETINGTSYTTSYAYDDDNRVTSVANGDVNGTYTYDEFGRLKEKETKSGTNNVVTEELTYRDITVTTDNGTVNTTTAQVANLTVDIANASSTDISFTYTYDANGNITSVNDGTYTTNYHYDKANQLIREDNPAANKIWIWTYDNAGNITSRAEYAYTDDANLTGGTTTTYTYNNSNWGDLLTSYKVGDNAAVTIASDSIGNMTSDGIRTYTWEHGRELYTLTKNGVTWTNTYNADGLRTKRASSSATYNYVYNGSSLSQMSVGTNLLNFVYDASGSPMAVTYNGTTYYYVTNLQGDVVAILDSSGASMVKYTYNAWGMPISTTGTMAATLGAHNPLRYRGYVYDTESALYYLRSRYYDPEIGRFINADAFPSTGQGIIGNNMFAYCGNNPVTRTDIGGYFWDTVLDVISLGVSIANVIENPDDPMAWLGVAADVASLIVPCVAGGGALVRAATKADDVVDAFKAADNLGEVGEVIVKYGDEVKLPNQIKVNDAVDAWDDFLGPNQTSYNKFTGTNEMDRIFSADGTRSIRFGGHEMRSIGTTKAHFHYENWLFDPTSNTVYVENILQRLK